MKKHMAAAAIVLSLTVSTSAFAGNDCEVLLCLAGNWQGIAKCVPPVRAALRDAALGRAWPHCSMASSTSVSVGSNGTRPSTADSAPTSEATCPVMYSDYDRKTGAWLSCRFAGVIEVVVDGTEWEQVFWATNGDTSTWYSPAAKTQLGSGIDPTYDDDLGKCGRCLPPPITGPQN